MGGLIRLKKRRCRVVDYTDIQTMSGFLYVLWILRLMANNECFRIIPQWLGTRGFFILMMDVLLNSVWNIKGLNCCYECLRVLIAELWARWIRNISKQGFLEAECYAESSRANGQPKNQRNTPRVGRCCNRSQTSRLPWLKRAVHWTRNKDVQYNIPDILQ